MKKEEMLKLDNAYVVLGHILSYITSFFAYIFMGSENYAKFLVVAMVTDVLTGVIAAGINGELSSSGFFGNLSKGLLKKMLVWIMLIALSLGAVWLELPWIRESMLIFYIGGEVLSILENLNRCGVPFPKFLTNIFLAMKEKGDQGNNEVNK